MERCMNCGCDDIVELQDGFHCQRCGAVSTADGSCEYEPDRIGENIQNYDDYFEDR